MTESDPKRIALLLPNLAGGGAERLSLTLAHEFAAAGHAPEFVVMEPTGELLDEALAAFPVHDLGSPRVRQLLRPLAAYLRDHQPHALIAAMWPLTALVPLLARLSGYRGKVVITEHAALSHQYAGWGLATGLFLRASVFVGYRLAAARIGVSRGTSADIAALARMAPQRITTIYNPIPLAATPSPEACAAAEVMWGAKGGRILSVGKLKAQKNHALLLRAFAALPRKEARLLLLGDGPEEQALRALSRDLGIGERVVFAGFHRDPSPFYATADLFVLSSDYEGFGNVIVEALSYGLRVVSTDCPAGPAEILADGAFGKLVPVGDAAALAQTIDEALDAPVDRAAQIRRAADFAPDIAARQYLAVMGL